MTEEEIDCTENLETNDTKVIETERRSDYAFKVDLFP